MNSPELGWTVALGLVSGLRMPGSKAIRGGLPAALTGRDNWRNAAGPLRQPVELGDPQVPALGHGTQLPIRVVPERSKLMAARAAATG